MNNYNKYEMTRNIYKDFYLIVDKKILLKSTLCICEKLYVTNIALYQATLLFR